MFHIDKLVSSWNTERGKRVLCVKPPADDTSVLILKQTQGWDLVIKPA